MDCDGNQLAPGDIIEIVQMDDLAYAFLVGVRGVVEVLGEGGDTLFAVLQNNLVPAIGMETYRARKVE